MEMILLGLYAGWSLVNAFVADAKGKGMAGALLLSLVCTPFLVYLYLLAIPSLKPAP